MDRKALLAAGLLACAAPAQAELRLEGSIGFAKHRLAQDGSWHYSGFDTDVGLLPGSLQIGAAWLPLKYKNWHYGVRAGYADLGKVTATNSFPIFEDGSQNDARVNSNCVPTTLSGCTGRFQGAGTTTGWYLGPVVEYNFGAGVRLGMEGGVLLYTSSWRAKELHAVDNAGNTFIPEIWKDFVWDQAQGTHVTPYLGVNARWREVILSTRIYQQIHASQAKLNPGFVGLTSGPVISVLLGVSWGI